MKIFKSLCGFSYNSLWLMLNSYNKILRLLSRKIEMFNSWGNFGFRTISELFFHIVIKMNLLILHYQCKYFFNICLKMLKIINQIFKLEFLRNHWKF